MKDIVVVNDKKLEAVARFIEKGDITGENVCGFFLQSTSKEMRDEINAPCNASGYADDWCFNCPLFTKENFLKWIELDEKLSVEEIKRPKETDFVVLIDAEGRPLTNFHGYSKALEKYCKDLENLLADFEYDLENVECENKALLNKLEKIRGVLDEGY